MDPFRILVRICECDGADATFDAFVSAIEEAVPLRSVLRIRASDAAVLERRPASIDVSPELRQAAARALHPEIFPLGSQFPHEAAEFHDADMLLVPLRGDGEDETIVAVVDSGALGEDVLVWEELTRAMEQVRAQCRRLSESNEERKELRQRAEESEALHTLGLSANRTLNQDEVLSLVTRFARTLLGAHYTTVHTREGDRLHLVASVGLRDDDGNHADDAFARRVVDAEKPVIVGADGSADLETFSFHQGQGMKAGLGMPLALYGDTFGALVVGYRRDYRVRPRDVRLAVTLAGHAAVAISNAHLHRKLEAHARELDSAYSQLREVTRAKERFFNAISHDLRTPVSAIKGYSELMLEGLAGQLPERAEKYIRSSYRASKSLLALVNDLMDFAKLEAGKLAVTVEATHVSEVLEDALATVQPQAESKGIQLAAPEPSSLPMIQTDPRRLRQILVNLMSNAVKFTDEGTVTVSVEATADRLEIRVQDTGRGIPAHDQARIFQEFEQVSGSEGTGLGLPISHKLAELLGGELRVESEAGVGSTFILTLPQAGPAPEPEALEIEAPGPEASEPEASEPEASEPEASEPEASEPEASEPNASEHRGSKPGRKTEPAG